RMAYQPADDASVASRKQYFLRSMAVFQIARANWLYGGAMIGTLVAVSMLSKTSQRPLLEEVLYILSPAVLGFIGFALPCAAPPPRRRARPHPPPAPAVRSMLVERLALAKEEHARAKLEQLRAVSWRSRLMQVAVPVVCVAVYLLWNGSGIHQDAIKK